MDSVTRYSHDSDYRSTKPDGVKFNAPFPAPSGKWVKYEDLVAANKRIQQLEKLAEEIRNNYTETALGFVLLDKKYGILKTAAVKSSKMICEVEEEKMEGADPTEARCDFYENERCGVCVIRAVLIELGEV